MASVLHGDVVLHGYMVKTLAEQVTRAAHALRAAGVPDDDASRDAVRLARHVLGWDAATWLSRSRETGGHDFQESFDALVARRLTREPLPHILGVHEFYGRPFRVTADVLTPRPETELLVDAALAILDARGARELPAAIPPLRVVDVGTGSGCIAVTLAAERPAVLVAATDASAAALGIARANARDLGVADRVAFHEADLLGDDHDEDDEIDRPFDLIVANLPYVPEGDRASLAPEVARFEPAAALFAGADGLDAIRRLIPAAARALAPGGALILEVGIGQAATVSDLIAATGNFDAARTYDDLQGIPRVLNAR
jgi:release factor glutamine methyltransferase